MDLIRNVSDTALWAASFRAEETKRKDALFRDPFAERLAGERGRQIAAAMPMNDRNAWAWVMRTYIVDEYVTQQVAGGVDLVVNLAAGLDTRPYRMPLPPRLRWVEVDLPELVDYKESLVAGEVPHCELERVRMDLSELRPRRALFDRLGLESQKALIITEGLLIYLAPNEVASLAADLARPRGFRLWATDVVSPGLRTMMEKQDGRQLMQAGAPFKFAPVEGPDFFLPHGWRPLTVRSTFRTAARLKRLPFMLRLFAFLPDPKGPAGKRPWSGICLLEKSDPYHTATSSRALP
jgi:methyltransferase (TIGR00027 family)